MKKLLPALFPLLVALPMLGCPGDDGGAGETTAIFDAVPRAVAVARPQIVQVRAVGTAWTPETIGVGEVSFGDGIDVLTVSVANARNVVVEIQAHVDAIPGPRALTIGGVTRTDLFQVVPAVTLSDPAPIPAGSFFNVSLDGFDTDWDPVNTTVDLGTGVTTSGEIAGHVLKVDVVRKDRIDVFGYLDLFAGAGANDIVVTSGSYTDTLTAALSIEAAIPTAVAAGDNVGTITTPFQPAVYSLSGAFAERLTAGLAGSGLTDPIALVFSSASGSVPIQTVRPAQDLSELVFVNPTETLHVSVFDALLGGGSNYGFTLSFAQAPVSANVQVLADGINLANQQFMAAGEELWYQIDGATAFSMGTVDWTPNGGGVGDPPDGVLDLFREGTGNATEDNGGVNVAEQLTMAIGVRPTTFLRVTEQTGISTMADSSFDIIWNETPVPGTAYPSAPAFIALDDPQAQNETATTVATLMVADAIDISETRVVVDIAHPRPEELRVEIVRPGGNPILLHNQTPGTARGVLEVYGAGGTVPNGGLDNLSGNGQGTWSLVVTDSVPGDRGFIRGWAVYIVPD